MTMPNKFYPLEKAGNASAWLEEFSQRNPLATTTVKRIGGACKCLRKEKSLIKYIRGKLQIN